MRICLPIAYWRYIAAGVSDARVPDDGASDDITGGVVSSDAALSGPWVAYKPVVLILASTLGFYNLPEWAGSHLAPRLGLQYA